MPFLAAKAAQGRNELFQFASLSSTEALAHQYQLSIFMVSIKVYSEQ